MQLIARKLEIAQPGVQTRQTAAAVSSDGFPSQLRGKRQQACPLAAQFLQFHPGDNRVVERFMGVRASGKREGNESECYLSVPAFARPRMHV